MPKRRDINLSKYDIDVWEFRRLYYSCLQYPDKKLKLSELRCPIKVQLLSDMPHGGMIVSQTEQSAIQAAELSKYTELIEQTAIETDSVLYSYILLAVTNQDIKYHTLKLLQNIPCNEKEFEKLRRLFYFKLSKKM